jgi:hypothetical protein
VKRRALLLGALLMPMPARARASSKRKQATKKPPAVAPRPLVNPAPSAREAKTQLVAFNASAFPYSGIVPDTNKPFLDARNGRMRGHTSLRGEVYWESPTYIAARCSTCRPATTSSARG